MPPPARLCAAVRRTGAAVRFGTVRTCPQPHTPNTVKPHNNPPAPKPATPATLDRVTFGERLKQTRKQYGWTLQKLADISGVSITTISRAERGQIALGYDNISALGQALQIDIGELFANVGHKPAPFTKPVVTRAGDGVSYKGRTVSYEFLGTTASGKKMSPVLATIHSRAIEGPASFAKHDGEEFVYVISGAIDVHFDNGDCIQLSRGDSLYFDSRIGHAYVSTSRQLAKVVAVLTEEIASRRGEFAP